MGILATGSGRHSEATPSRHMEAAPYRHSEPAGEESGEGTTLTLTLSLCGERGDRTYHGGRGDRRFAVAQGDDGESADPARHSCKSHAGVGWVDRLGLSGSSPRRLGLEIFLFFLLLYSLAANGRLVNRDGETMFQVARSIAEQGSFDVPAESVFDQSEGPRGTEGDSMSFATETAMRGTDGRLYSMYGLGQSLVSVPLYYAGKLMALGVPQVSPYFTTRFATAALNPLVSALTCAVLFACAYSLGFTRRASLVVTLIYGLATMAWPYAKSYASEPLAGLMLILSSFCLIRSRLSHRHLLWSAMAGSALGFAVMVRISTGILFPVFAIYWLALGRERVERGLPPPPSTLHPWLKEISAFFAPLALFLALIGLYNLVRFGSPLVTGYQSMAWNRPFVEGLYGLLLSPGKGLFLYNPVLILSVAGFVALFRWRRREALFFLGLSLVWIAFHAPLRFWEGGWSWGPRLLLPILPFLFLPLLGLRAIGGEAGPANASTPAQPAPHPRIGGFSRYPRRGPQARLGFLDGLGSRLLPVAIAVSLAIQVLGVGVDYTRYLWSTYSTIPDDAYVRVVHQPAGSPLVAQWADLAGVIANAIRPGELAKARGDILAKERNWSAGGMAGPEISVAVLTQTQVAGLNFPDFWFVYLYLFGAPAIPIVIAVAAISAGTGAMLVVLDRRLRELKAEKGWSG